MFEKEIPYLRNTRRENNQIGNLLEYNLVMFNLKPGDKISEVEICKEIGCSRTPVHNAFLMLQYFNLLEIIPQVGTIVTSLNEELIDSVCFLRRIMELENLRTLASQHKCVDERLLSRLRACLEVQEQSAKERDYWTLFETDNEIHELFFIATGMMPAYRIIQDQLINFSRLRVLIYQDNELDRIIREHHELIDNYEKGDFDQMQDVLERHLADDLIARNKQSIRKQYPEYFGDLGCNGRIDKKIP